MFSLSEFNDLIVTRRYCSHHYALLNFFFCSAGVCMCELEIQPFCFLNSPFFIPLGVGLSFEGHLSIFYSGLETWLLSPCINNN